MASDKEYWAQVGRDAAVARRQYHRGEAGRRQTKRDRKKTKAERERKARARSKDRLRRLRSMPYGLYLKTPHWRRTRKQALKRAEYRCERCHRSNRVLHVHHTTYERRGREKKGDLEVVCVCCHDDSHADMLAARDLDDQFARMVGG